MLRAFFVQYPGMREEAVVIAANAGKARYSLYFHCKELYPDMLRQGCGLRFYNLTHFTVKRAPGFDPLATLHPRPANYSRYYAEINLSLEPTVPRP